MPTSLPATLSPYEIEELFGRSSSELSVSTVAQNAQSFIPKLSPSYRMNMNWNLNKRSFAALLQASLSRAESASVASGSLMGRRRESVWE